MKTLVVRSLATAMCVMTCGATAEATTITYLVEFAQSGNVAVGSTLDWTLSYVVSDVTTANLGVRQAIVDLRNETVPSMGANVSETMTPANFIVPFSFAFTSPGTVEADGLREVGYTVVSYNPGLIAGEDGNLGPHAFATGSYTVTTAGVHTLSLSEAIPSSNYFTAATNTDFRNYDTIITTSSATVTVVPVGVPEPGSMMLASTLLFPGVMAVRRRRRKRTADLTA